MHGAHLGCHLARSLRLHARIQPGPTARSPDHIAMLTLSGELLAMGLSHFHTELQAQRGLLRYAAATSLEREYEQTAKGLHCQFTRTRSGCQCARRKTKSQG
jgi:hypothetical protein